ncbi:MAG: hypothetical protein JO320_28325 [Alphaproteobacteria bacterium]|nr:hypothetical protein [Alphaproteobacteria bacterium]
MPNLSTRLQALAEPDAIVIAETTRRLVGGLFDWSSCRPTGNQLLYRRGRACRNRAMTGRGIRDGEPVKPDVAIRVGRIARDCIEAHPNGPAHFVGGVEHRAYQRLLGH